MGGIFGEPNQLLNVPLREADGRPASTFNRLYPGRAKCNGFSAGVNPDDFRGPGFQSGYDPVWTDLMEKHCEEPFHMLMGGGDQLYCDGVIREPELQGWLHTTKQDKKKSYKLTDEISLAIDRFYFNHYCQTFRSGVFAKANCRMWVVPFYLTFCG